MYEFFVVYIVFVVWNFEMFIYFVEIVRKVGLRMIEVSESMWLVICLVEVNGFNRLIILIYRL